MFAALRHSLHLVHVGFVLMREGVFALSAVLPQGSHAEVTALDSGKTIYDCETVDVPETVNCLTWHAELIDKAKNLTKVTGPTLYCLQLYFNTAKKGLDNLKVRQAINFALDRNAFVKASLAGVGEPAHMQLPKNHWAYDPTLVGLYPHNIEKAKAVLDAAGWKPGADGVRAKGGRRLSVLFQGAVGATSQSVQAVVKQAEEQFKDAGWRVRTRQNAAAGAAGCAFTGAVSWLAWGAAACCARSK